MFSRDKQPTNPYTGRDGENHRHDDVVFAGHLKGHGDGSHYGACATADHGSHSHHGESGNADWQRERRCPCSSAAKPPPKVAPMKRDGEKMPPDDPEPKLIDVATALQTNNSASSHASEVCPVRMLSIVA